MLNGIYVLGSGAFELIYGPEEREAIGRLVRVPGAPETADSVKREPARLATAEVLFSGWGAPRLDAELLAAAPRLKAVFYGAGSIRGVVTDAFWDRGLRITSAAAANAEPVAEYTLAMILLSLKHAWPVAREVQRAGGYNVPRNPPGAYRTTVGLVSLGLIGRRVRELLRAFDLRVLAYDPFLSPARAAELGVESVPLDQLFAESDVISLHTPWLPETEGLITGRHFEAMRAGATFINTARGAVVREPEMVAVLQRRAEIYAVLDVTWPEPPPAGSPLYSLPNVFLTPHMAGSMGAECHRMGRFMASELQRYLNGEPMLGEVTRESAARLA